MMQQVYIKWACFASLVLVPMLISMIILQTSLILGLIFFLLGCSIMNIFVEHRLVIFQEHIPTID